MLKKILIQSQQNIFYVFHDNHFFFTDVISVYD